MSKAAEDQPQTPRIQGLDALMKACQVAGDAPVAQWNPPYCGDIGLAIAADGTWMYRDSPITRLSLVKLFARVLTREPDGSYYLVTPAEKVDVAVADAPFVAVEMEIRNPGDPGAQELILRTNLDEVMGVGRVHPLRFCAAPHGGTKPYVGVRRGLSALLSRALTYDLLEHVSEDDDGRAGVYSGGTFFPLPD